MPPLLTLPTFPWGVFAPGFIDKMLAVIPARREDSSWPQVCLTQCPVALWVSLSLSPEGLFIDGESRWEIPQTTVTGQALLQAAREVRASQTWFEQKGYHSLLLILEVWLPQPKSLLSFKVQSHQRDLRQPKSCLTTNSWYPCWSVHWHRTTWIKGLFPFRFE